MPYLRSTSNMASLPIALAFVAIAGLAPCTASAQLTLAAALRQADHSGYANRVAAGTAAAQAARTIAPLQGILPNVRLEAGYVRTTDPIGVFGDKLRQGIITQSDFDPQRLNNPAAMGNYQGGLVLEQPIFNADSWAARAAATHGASASQAAATWTRLTTRVDVVRAYYGAVLASERVATLDAASRSAHAHVTQTEAMVRQGLVTRSDALLASVRAGEIDAQLAEARGGVETARRQLAMMLGRPQSELAADTAAPVALPSPERIRAVVAGDTNSVIEARADVLSAQQQSAAARADALRARATYLPRINSFARYDWNAANRPYSGERNWTVGIMASWNPFGSATELSDIRATAGAASAARAQADAATAEASLDVAQTRIALSVALTRLDIAEQAVAQSAEANRIVSRKYQGGLASIVDLLDAQAVETRSALALTDARYRVIVADAERRRAVGGDPATLAALDRDAAAPATTVSPNGAANTTPAESHAQIPR
jgi:outer membrane protein